MRLKPDETKVLAALASIGGGDFSYANFRSIARRTRMNRRSIRLACRSLARKKLAVFGRGLWTEDGEVAGSGYSVTALGVEVADDKLVEKYVVKFWDSY